MIGGKSMNPHEQVMWCRVMWRVAEDYGRHAAELKQLEHMAVEDPRSLYQKTRVWKVGSYTAWRQIKTLLDTGHVVDPWKQNAKKENAYVS